MIIFVFGYLGFCLLLALLGNSRKFGFWGYFFCSLFLTPIIGAIILLGSDKCPKKIDKCPRCDYPLEKRD